MTQQPLNIPRVDRVAVTDWERMGEWICGMREDRPMSASPTSPQHSHQTGLVVAGEGVSGRHAEAALKRDPGASPQPVCGRLA